MRRHEALWEVEKIFDRVNEPNQSFAESSAARIVDSLVALDVLQLDPDLMEQAKRYLEIGAIVNLENPAKIVSELVEVIRGLVYQIENRK